MKLAIGIDPGVNGSIAFVPEHGEAWAHKMPETMQDILDVLDDCTRADFTEVRAYIEKVSSSPQMGVVSAFTFGQGFGRLEMALTAKKIPFEYVRPQVWQKELGCMSKGDKNKTKARSQQAFPYLRITHAIADGLLLGEYGIRVWK